LFQNKSHLSDEINYIEKPYIPKNQNSNLKDNEKVLNIEIISKFEIGISFVGFFNNSLKD
jgi:hypothetical protein